MPLQLSRMTEADIPAFAAVDAAGMANWGMAQAMNLAQPGGEPREVWVERWMRADFRNDDEMAWVKVTDPEAGGEMIAAALWDFRLREKKEKANEEVEVEVEVGAPAEGAAPVAKPEEQHGVMAALGKLAKEFHDEFIGTKPFASMHPPPIPFTPKLIQHPPPHNCPHRTTYITHPLTHHAPYPTSQNSTSSSRTPHTSAAAPAACSCNGAAIAPTS